MDNWRRSDIEIFHSALIMALRNIRSSWMEWMDQISPSIWPTSIYLHQLLQVRQGKRWNHAIRFTQAPQNYILAATGKTWISDMMCLFLSFLVLGIWGGKWPVHIWVSFPNPITWNSWMRFNFLSSRVGSHFDRQNFTSVCSASFSTSCLLIVFKYS